MSLIILAIPLLLLWFMVSRGRKQQRELAATQDALVAGTRVMTSSGMYAEVVEVEDDAVVLEIAPGVHTRWNKRAIGQVLPSAGSEGEDTEDDDDEDSGTAVLGSTDSPDDLVTPDSSKRSADIRSEAGYTVPAEPGVTDVTEGSAGTTGTAQTPGTTGTDGR